MASMTSALLAAILLLQPSAAFDILLFPALTRANQNFFESMEAELRLMGHGVTLLVLQEHLGSRAPPPGAILVPEGADGGGAAAALQQWEQEALDARNVQTASFRPVYSDALQRQCEALLGRTDILAALRTRIRPNMVLADVGYGTCGLALGRLLNTSVVGVQATPPPLYTAAPSYLPAFVDRNFWHGSGFWERLQTALEGLLGAQQEDEDLYGDLSMVLVNGFPAWDAPVRPVYPKLVYVGGLNFHITTLFPRDLELIAREHRAGIILVTLVSSISNEQLPDYVRTSLIGGLGRIPHAIFWKANLSNATNLTKNMFLNEQFESQNIMGHVRTRLVITFCDRDTVFASIYHRVPLLCIPVLEDQVELARRVEQQGVGVVLKLSELNADSLIGAIQSIITNESFKERVRYHSDLLKDEPNTANERLVYWTKYVILRQGALHLRNPSLQLNLTLPDIVILVASTILATAVVFFALCWTFATTKVVNTKKPSKHKKRKSD